MGKILNKDNSEYKLLVKLQYPKYRKDYGLFIAEGKRFIEMNPKKVYSLFDDNFTMISESLFTKLSSLVNSEGYISLFEHKFSEVKDMEGDLIILDRVQNPDNMGAIMRNMVAFGFNNLVLTKGSCDPLNPKVVRASMGGVLKIKIGYLDDFDLKEYKVILADLNGKEFEEKGKKAIVFGNESNGISDKFKGEVFTIPISKELDSLNVAVASGILLYKMRKI